MSTLMNRSSLWCHFKRNFHQLLAREHKVQALDTTWFSNCTVSFPIPNINLHLIMQVFQCFFLSFFAMLMISQVPRSRSFWNSAVGVGQWNLHEVPEGPFVRRQESHCSAWWGCRRWTPAYCTNSLLGLHYWKQLCFHVLPLMVNVLHYLNLFLVFCANSRCYWVAY